MKINNPHLRKTIFIMSLMSPIFALAAPVCMLANGAHPLGDSFYGKTNCGTGSINTMTVIGDANLSGTSVGTITITGDLDASNANVNNTKILGDLNGQNSNFGTITGTGVFALDSSSAQNIVVNGRAGLGAYAVYLGNHSIVGNITFSQGGGVVYVSGGSQIQGTVTGATVQNTGDGSSFGGPIAPM